MGVVSGQRVDSGVSRTKDDGRSRDETDNALTIEQKTRCSATPEDSSLLYSSLAGDLTQLSVCCLSLML